MLEPASPHEEQADTLAKLVVPDTVAGRCGMLASIITRGNSVVPARRIAFLAKHLDDFLRAPSPDSEVDTRVITAVTVALGRLWPKKGSDPGAPGEREAIRDRLVCVLAGRLSEFSGIELRHIIKAMAVSRLESDGLASALLSACETAVRPVPRDELPFVAWNLLQIGLRDRQRAQLLARGVIAEREALPLPSLLRSLAVFRKSGNSRAAVPEELVAELAKRALTLSADDTHGALLRCKLHGITDASLAASLVLNARSRVKEFQVGGLVESLELAQYLKAEGTKDLLRDALPLLRGSFFSLAPARQAGLVKVCGEARYYDQTIMQSLDQAVTTGAGAFDPKLLIKILRATVRLNYTNDATLHAVRDGILERLPELNAWQLGEVVWGFASHRWRDVELFGRVARRVCEEGAATVQRIGPKIAWSFAHVNIQDRELFTLLSENVRQGESKSLEDSQASLAWAMAVHNADLVPKVCRAEELERQLDDVVWLQMYQALLVSGQVSAGQWTSKAAGLMRSESGRSIFESDVVAEIQKVLYVQGRHIQERRLICGIETDLVISTSGRPIVVECDGDRYHRTRGPDGGTPMGADILQDRIFILSGYEVCHILASDFYGPGRVKAIDDLGAMIRKQRHKEPLPAGVRRLLP